MGRRMPFSTDTAWPQGLRTIFDICRQQREPLENRYYGPYDKLLNYCFGDSFQYFVAPQRPPSGSNLTLRDTVDFVTVVFLVVFDANDRRPVLIAEIKDDAWAHKADLRVYCGTLATETIEPDFVPRPSPSRILPRHFLEGAWDIDILSPEGFNKMKEIVTDVLAAAPAAAVL